MSGDAPSAVCVAAAPEDDAAVRLTANVSFGDRLRRCPIVVAVSGEPDGAGPVRVASALQRRFGSAVSAVQVMDTSDIALLTPLPAPLIVTAMSWVSVPSF